MGIGNITECLTRWLVRKGHFELKFTRFYRHSEKCLKCLDFRKFENCEICSMEMSRVSVVLNFCCLKV